MIQLKKPEMQGAKFSRNEKYLSYVTMTEKLKQRSKLGFSAESINTLNFSIHQFINSHFINYQ